MSTLYSIGALNQLGDALENAGYTADDITKLKQFKDLKGLKAVIQGKASISFPNNLIDCDANPIIPVIPEGEMFANERWYVQKHKRTGLLLFDPQKVSFYLSDEQKKTGAMEGKKLMNDLEDKPILNANVLDWLLANPEFIPEEWKTVGEILFWGTLYNHYPKYKYYPMVRYLAWDKKKQVWDWGYEFTETFNIFEPAIIHEY